MTFKAKKNIELQKFNTFALHSIASRYAELEEKQDIEQAMQWVEKNRSRFFVIGEGSNIILRPEIDALILRNQIMGIDLIEETEQQALIRVGAGENWHQFVLQASANGWYGLENLALIPGSVGAAPVQNIGAYGVEVSSFIHTVHAWDNLAKTFVELSNEQCEFEYRNSIFRANTRFIISHVDFQLPKVFSPVISYAPLQQLSNGQVEPQQLIEFIVEIRQSKLPTPAELPNVGSFFKNPLVSHAEFNIIKTSFPEVVSYPAGEQVKLAAGWLIEHAGLKGERFGNLGMYGKQALVMVNYGEADGNTVLRFATQVQEMVFARFSVRLEMEPVII